MLLSNSTSVYGFEVIFMSGVMNGGLAHVGGATCGHARCERRSMFGEVFREHHHLGLCRQTILFLKSML